jgi:hypothetical protein
MALGKNTGHTSSAWLGRWDGLYNNRTAFVGEKKRSLNMWRAGSSELLLSQPQSMLTVTFEVSYFIHFPDPAWTWVTLQALSLSFPTAYTSSGLLIPESTLSILTLDRDNSLVTIMLFRLWPSSMLLKLSPLLLPGSLGVSRRRVFSYLRRRTAMRGTARMRQTMAITMPIIAPGLKPSLRETVFGAMAGGASGMLDATGVGAIMYVSIGVE